MSTMHLAHLYPSEMNIYGDLGNITALTKRLEWRGYDVKVDHIEVGKPYDLTKADIIFGGGGQDSGQMLVGSDLIDRGQDLRAAAADGVPMLMICGLYQLFGRGFTTQDGREIPGIDVFRASTVGSNTRMIGNLVVESRFGKLVGFENHSGQTTLEPGQEPLGKVSKGFGNNEKSGFEGAVTHNAIGCYLHGPALPKNPALADHLILAALKRRFGVTALAPLDDSLELAAARVASDRPQ